MTLRLKAELMINEPLLDSEFIRRLERFSLASRKRLAGQDKGERRSLQRGNSVNFVDYRHYVAGDDLRQVDWNIYGRLGSLLLKRYEDEQTFTLSVILDISRSMDWGEPNKLTFARRIAASLGYLALVGFDRVRVAAVGERIARTYGPERGRRHAHTLFRFLTDVRPEGTTDLGAALRGFAAGLHAPGLVVILSDLMSPHGYQDGLGYLLQSRCEVVLLHVLAPEEIHPQPAGDFRLVDRETYRAVDITLDGKAVELYRQRFEHWTSEIADYCRRRAITYELVPTDMPLDDFLFKILRRQRVLQ